MITCQFFLFAKTHGSFLIQSTNIILWATFTLYSINLHYFRSILSFFLEILPPGQLTIFQNHLLTSNRDVTHIIGSFTGLLIYLCEQRCRKQPQNTYFGHFGGIFWQGRPSENQFLRKMRNLLSFTLYYYIYKVSCQTN